MKNYQKYLAYLDEKLSGFFEQQKEYIKCKKGCSMCCKNGEYPYSETEFKYLLQGFVELDKQTQDIIEQNIINTLEAKKEFKGEKFIYNCPFLINNICSVYDFRGIVCRTFGLIENNIEKVKIPFCANLSLNYSDVIDEEKGIISAEKYKQSGFTVKPTGFNINYGFLAGEKPEKEFNFIFGEKKTLIDWFSDNHNNTSQ